MTEIIVLLWAILGLSLLCIALLLLSPRVYVWAKPKRKQPPKWYEIEPTRNGQMDNTPEPEWESGEKVGPR